MFLPPMRADLGWSYLTAGAMNTSNAAGYLAGALLAPAWLRTFGTRGAFLAGTAATAVFVAAHGLTTRRPAALSVPLPLRAGQRRLLRRRRPAGGAARRCGAGRGRARAPPTAGLVLGIYYGGAGLGIVVSAVGVPLLAERAVAHAWQGGWIVLGAIGGIVTAVIAAATRGLAARPRPAAAARGARASPASPGAASCRRSPPT